jgi:hypothetical protein
MDQRQYLARMISTVDVSNILAPLSTDERLLALMYWLCLVVRACVFVILSRRGLLCIGACGSGGRMQSICACSNTDESEYRVEIGVSSGAGGKRVLVSRVFCKRVVVSRVCGREGRALEVCCVARNVAILLLMRLVNVCNMDTVSLCMRSRWLKRLRLNKTPGNIRKVIYIYICRVFESLLCRRHMHTPCEVT